MRRRDRWAACVASALAACALTSTGSFANAAPARLAYAGGGSIFAVNADGSQWSRLTRGADWTSPIRDSKPLWSRDGGTIVFERWLVELSPDDWHGDAAAPRVFAMKADGSGKRRLLPSGPDVGEALIGLNANGRVLVRRADDVIAVDPDGRRPRKLRHPGRFRHGDVSMSPDGKRILYTEYRVDRYYNNRYDLWVMKADGSGRHRLARDGGFGRWSPDSKRIAFVSISDRNGSTCEDDYCDLHGEIYTTAADGSDRFRLTFNDADDREPTWSADGSRIAFASARNFPQFGAHEIYTIKPDRSCLTWVSNGSGDAEQPSWRAGGHTEPGTCGDPGLLPKMTLDLSPARRTKVPVYWLGPVAPGRMIPSHVTQAYAGIFGLAYADCGYFQPRRCGDTIIVDSDDACERSQYGPLTSLSDRTAAGDLRVEDGVLLRSDDPGGSLQAYAGPTTISVVSYAGRAGALFAHLRRLDPPAGERPPPSAFPHWFWRRLQRVEDSYARTHDDAKTAAELGLRPWQVKSRRRLAKRLRELGIDARFTCAVSD
jgi:hypothetical protein